MNFAVAFHDLFLQAAVMATTMEKGRPDPKPAPQGHPGANPRYNGMGRRYFDRSRYVPHQGAKEIARRARNAARAERKAFLKSFADEVYEACMETKQWLDDNCYKVEAAT